MSQTRRPPLRRLGSALTENIVLRVALYYALLFGAATLVWPHVAPNVREALLKSYAPNLDAAPMLTGVVSKKNLVVPPPAEPVALSVAGAVIAAFLLALPVAWIYMLTRERKGYRQSVVHTLVLLPVVVAGVVVLVKTSLTLAFSLAGIVAAVRFRNSLEDSKDAVFLFLATAVGLACGVEIEVAVVISVLFNAMTLALFYSDFGRTPPALEGERAQKQMERALAIANRTSQFVARIDDEVLRSMAPAQLEALASRARKRREETAPNLPMTTPEAEFDARLRIVTTDPEALRPLVEPVLDARVKRWRLDLVDTDGGDPVVAYNVRWRKGNTPSDVVAAVCSEGAPFVVHAEVS